MGRDDRYGRARLTTLVAVLAVGAVACGSGGGAAATTVPSTVAPTSTAATTTSSTTSSTTSTTTPPSTIPLPESETPFGKNFVGALEAGFALTQGFDLTQGECVATLFVDTVGVNALQKAGVTPEFVTGNTDPNQGPFPNFVPTDDQSSTMVDGMMQCVDFGAQVLFGLTRGKDTGVAQSKLDCLHSTMSTSAGLRTFLLKLIRNELMGKPDDTEFQNVLVASLKQCGFTQADVKKFPTG
jgi:hypothetical protein